ncbi:ABC transporter substrate-binding protein [Rhizobium sp. RM]|uniref:ABC transporter substrate-binding protein n=1 Tax=Rhizobium sp. RM TaxID=2748079 RepID=UPI00110D4F15|nr:ABC transporter substrate-binding protein [Rhizobium sp. RM]NWJ27112.1 carbohydrate ABC transporter substrate-binding protein [Rhizobium sp. RM]TMV20179.1 carbohydrate ABC transporter substrate-binding protein [Rhizobium sp. Td3]
MQTIDRRKFLMTAAMGVGALGLGATVGAFNAQAQENRLRCVWWGSADRSRRTNEVISLYQKADPKTAISGEMIAGSDYWTKLATSMAGRNVADIFQLEPSTIADYSGRGACMELDKFVGSSLDLSGFGKTEVDLCRIDGKLYGVGLGLNSFCMMYDAETLKEGGVSIPKEQITWKALAELAKDYKKNAPARRNYWAVPYGGRYHYVFDVWLRQRGKLLFQDGTIGFNKEDAKEWFAYWEDLRQAGLAVSADIQTRDDNTIESNSLTLGNSAIGFAYSNQLVGYQQLNKKTLSVGMLPGEGEGKPTGHYYRPGLIWSISSTSTKPEEAAKFISFFVNDVAAGKVLGVERGVPPSKMVREAVLPSLNETERKTVDYIEGLSGKLDPYPEPAPIGANEFDRGVMRPIADSLAFGRASVDEAAQNLVDTGTRTLRKRG